MWCSSKRLIIVTRRTVQNFRYYCVGIRSRLACEQVLSTDLTTLAGRWHEVQRRIECFLFDFMGRYSLSGLLAPISLLQHSRRVSNCCFWWLDIFRIQGLQCLGDSLSLWTLICHRRVIRSPLQSHRFAAAFLMMLWNNNYLFNSKMYFGLLRRTH